MGDLLHPLRLPSSCAERLAGPARKRSLGGASVAYETAFDRYSRFGARLKRRQSGIRALRACILTRAYL